ncbi:MAG: [protein-PII] uridylyltransferase [Verrucomicrobiota bacterium]
MASASKLPTRTPQRGLDSIANDPLIRRIRQHAERRMEIASGLPREERFPAYQRFVELESDMLRRYHEKGDSGFQVCRARAIVLDVLLDYLFADALATYENKHGSLPCRMALVATGGYGRGELAPHSDIDLMLLFPEKRRGEEMKAFEEIINEEILYPLWDLRFKVGNSSRTSEEAIQEARNEIKSKNAFLDARFICGSRGVFQCFREEYEIFIRRNNVREYIDQRLKDKRDRHHRYGGSVYVQEPDVKHAMGGLRDFHSVIWLANLSQGIRGLDKLADSKYMSHVECRDLFAAYDFLLRVRNEIHFQHKRPTDLLALDEQPKIAENLGYQQSDIFKRVERFMKDYYSHARNIYRISELMERRLIHDEDIRSGRRNRISLLTAIRARRYNPQREIDGFLNEERVLFATSKRVFEEEPVRLIRVFRHAQQLGARLDFGLSELIIKSLPLIDRRLINSPDANRAFRSILQSAGEVYPTLAHMHELGVLERFVPEFGRLSCLVQHEYYHRYTADVHVLNTIRELDRVFNKADPEVEPYLEALLDNDTPRLLYLILLLHDIGKAFGIKGHAETGVEAARPVLDRMQIGGRHREEILFIIANHLEMARFWQKFDIDDPETAQGLAEKVGDANKLRFLYVHTYCDARGTAAGLWNSYKNSLHHTLFKLTLAQLDDGEQVAKSLKERKPMLQQQLIQAHIPGVSEEEIEAHFNQLPERYFVHHSPEEVELHIRMIHQLLAQIQEADSVGSLVPIVDWHDDINQSLTVVNVVTWDRAGLFYKLAGALSAAGLNILSTKAISRADHITIDTFYVVETGGGFVRDEAARRIFEQEVSDALTRNKDLMPAIEAQAAKLKKQRYGEEPTLQAPFPSRVDVYHELSLGRTIIEVQAEDHLGLLYQLAKTIFDKGFDINFARISTERGVAMDTFYIERITGLESDGNQALLDLREALNALVRGQDGQRQAERLAKAAR